ncbi:MAG: phosphoribosylanthranilate isomerase, partial [Ruminococcus bromii]
MKVKICGITSAEDIKIVNACKPDFAGFVMFFPKSKRN